MMDTYVLNRGGRGVRSPANEWIVLKACDQGLAGATVLRDLMGFGAHSRLHTFKIERLSLDLPIIVELVDSLIAEVATRLNRPPESSVNASSY